MLVGVLQLSFDTRDVLTFIYLFIYLIWEFYFWMKRVLWI